MLKFFRRIRLRFLKDGSFKNYFLYAIGEIVLVVIGILIALQISNWNEDAQRSELEKQILKELKTELVNNKYQLDQVIEDKEISLAVCQTLLPSVIEQKNLLTDSQIDSVLTLRPPNRVVYASAKSSKIDSLLGSIPSYWVFLPRIGNIKAIIYSGNINYINDSDIKRCIAEFEDRVKSINFAITGADDILLEKIQPKLRENLKGQKEDFGDLLTDLDFRFFLRDYMGWTSSTVSVSEDFSQTMGAIISKIEEEISEK